MRRWLEIQIFFRQPVLNTESKECGFLGACFRCHKINLRRSGVIHRVKRVFSCFSVAMSRLTKHIWKYLSGYKRKEIFHSLRPVHVVVAQLEPWHSNRSEALPRTLMMSKKTKLKQNIRTAQCVLMWPVRLHRHLGLNMRLQWHSWVLDCT